MKHGYDIYIKYLTQTVTLFFAFTITLNSQDEKEFEDLELPAQVRFVRTYSSLGKSLPPIIQIERETNTRPAFAGSSVIIEIDVAAQVPPSLYVEFVHCTMDWQETENVFLQSITNLRTSNIDWESAPAYSDYYHFRGKLEVPNFQVKFEYPGNWKAKYYDYEDNALLATVRFFVVESHTNVVIDVNSTSYQQKFNVSNTALNLDAYSRTDEPLLNGQFRGVTFYNNARWYEPYYVRTDGNNDYSRQKYRYPMQTDVGGFSSYEKIFRLSGLPSENGYRLLELGNLAQYPRTNTSTRVPFSDIPRNGSFLRQDDGGVMVDAFLSGFDDDYVNVEFVLDPLNKVSREEVFVVGSFNNWKPDKDWQMYYDKKNNQYKLRHWVRRARHNYLYATGMVNPDTGEVEKYSYDEFEGNTAYSGHNYWAMVYYRFIDFGGYDALIGIGNSSIFTRVRR